MQGFIHCVQVVTVPSPSSGKLRGQSTNAPLLAFPLGKCWFCVSDVWQAGSGAVLGLLLSPPSPVPLLPDLTKVR